MNNNQLRVGVLLGGSSNEKEISFDSGRNIVYKLSPAHYVATPLFVTAQHELYKLTSAQLVFNSTKEVETSLHPASRLSWSSLKESFDFIFIGLHGGLGENGGVQGTLEMLGIPYNGSGVLTSALCMDKYKTSHYLRSQGFETPASLLIAQQEWQTEKNNVISRILTTFTLPIIVKPHDDGCSFMVQKITAPEHLATALEQLFATKSAAMIEEFITGMELTVGVLGNNNPQALPPSQAIANGNVLSIEEKFLPGAGENQTPAPLPEETLALVRRIMEAVYTAVGCKGYARIDCFYQSAQQSLTGKERVIIIELNTLPGMTPATCLFHQAAEIGMRPSELIDKIVHLGLEQHAQQHTTPTVEKQHDQQLST